MVLIRRYVLIKCGAVRCAIIAARPRLGGNLDMLPHLVERMHQKSRDRREAEISADAGALQRALEGRAHLIAQLRREAAVAAQHQDQMLAAHQAIELHRTETAELGLEGKADPVVPDRLVTLEIEPQREREIAEQQRQGEHAPFAGGLIVPEPAQRVYVVGEALAELGVA